MMTWEEAGRYRQLEGKKRGMQLGLGRMKKLLEFLGSPDRKMSFIQIAGTNGKGSTAAYLEEMLLAAGYAVGKYTSPAVFRVNEQFRAFGKEITEEEFCRCLFSVKEASDRMEQEGYERPTLFEQETGTALLWFAQKGCRLAVLEAGLGGDEDATNAVEKTILSLLTPISRDHWRILGNTISEIAGHKAGIIKAGVPVVCSGQPEEAMRVIRAEAEKKLAPLTEVDSKEGKIDCADERGLTVSYKKYRGLHLKQKALWQLANLETALEAADALNQAGYRIPEEAVRFGAEHMVWHGRFELISSNPELILDGAHNEAGAKALRESLDFWYPGKKIFFVTGVFADKDYPAVLKQLLTDREAEVFATESDSPRALSAGLLAEEVRHLFPEISVYVCEKPKEAVKQAAEAAGTEGTVVVCGSLSFLKNIKS